MYIIYVYKIYSSLQFLVELPIMFDSMCNIPVVRSFRMVEYFSTSGSTVASLSENFSISQSSPTTVFLKYLFKIIIEMPRLLRTDSWTSRRSDYIICWSTWEKSNGSYSISSQILNISWMLLPTITLVSWFSWILDRLIKHLGKFMELCKFGEL